MPSGSDFPLGGPSPSVVPRGTGGEGGTILPGTVDTACSQSFRPRSRLTASWLSPGPMLSPFPLILHACPRLRFPTPVGPAVLQLETRSTPFACPTTLSTTDSEGGPGSDPVLGAAPSSPGKLVSRTPTLTEDFGCPHFDPKLASWVLSSLFLDSGGDPEGKASINGTETTLSSNQDYKSRQDPARDRPQDSIHLTFSAHGHRPTHLRPTLSFHNPGSSSALWRPSLRSWPASFPASASLK